MSEENVVNNTPEESCTHDCSTCSANCSSRTQGGASNRESFLAPANKNSRVKKVIGVVSGKGGVGKSFVTVNLAVQLQQKGYQCAILDADITGPSIPKSLGVKGPARGNDDGIWPVESSKGIRVMSINLLLDEEESPVIWRGPVIAGTVKQFWTDVCWGDVDYMFVDMPPGTGDVPLTVFQSLPVDGIVIVTSPQELVSMIVGKAVKMARLMNIPVLALVENMSYVSCPDCGRRIAVFGESKIDETAKQFGVDIACRIPIEPKLTAAMDKGMIELFEGDWLKAIEEKLESDAK